MFSVYTPISYNTNFNSVLAHYQFGFCGGFCNPFASLFNRYSTFGSVANQFPSLYPTLCKDSFNIGSTPALNALPSFSPMGGFGSGRVIRDVSLPTVLAQPTGGNNMLGSSPNVFSNPFATPVQTHTVSSSAVPQTSSVSHNAKTTPSKTKTTKHTSATKPTQKPKTVSHNTQIAAAKSASALRQDFVNTARKYSNCNESDGSQRKFCINTDCKYEDPYDQEWCTDFVTYVVKEAYRKDGKAIPAGFGNHDVETMKNWAINNNYFIRTSNKAHKGSYIAENIKPGDIIILNENGASHTGFVTRTDKDGTVHTIEGNRDDKVTEYAYSPNYPDISGFIRLS
ncbi:MAG: CHAP domain-containing protein [Cyanobacteriota bacterium]|nr:CHAP domain-containing protein [Cyanobacteriota bacterium]